VQIDLMKTHRFHIDYDIIKSLLGLHLKNYSIYYAQILEESSQAIKLRHRITLKIINNYNNLTEKVHFIQLPIKFQNLLKKRPKINH
jgi:hypothetical protein